MILYNIEKCLRFQYYIVSYIFQEFYIFSQPTGGLVELLHVQYVSHFTILKFMPCKFGRDQSTVILYNIEKCLRFQLAVLKHSFM